VGPFSDANFVFDPHVVYNPSNDRWIATAVANPASPSAELLIGVSATSDPAGNWYRYAYLVDSSRTYWADYPLLGFNRDKIVVTFTYAAIQPGAPDNGSGLVIYDKASLYAGNTPASGSTYSFTFLDGASFGYNMVPAITYDTNQTAMYLVESINGNFNNAGYLVVYAIAGTVGSPSIVTNGYPQAAAWVGTGYTTNAQNFVPQRGTSQKIDSGDDRMGQVFYRFGSLWCAHAIFLPTNGPTHSLVQWWRVNPTNGNVFERGAIEDTGAVTNYAYPSIAVNKFKDVLIGYSSFAATQYASAGYSFKACTEGQGQMQNPAVLKPGISSYWRTNSFAGNTDLRNRWGDYSATTVDPANDTDLWTIQEYAAQYVGALTNGSGRWGTWWGVISPALPANDYFTNAVILSGAQATTNGTVVRATRETGEPNHGGNANTPSVWYRWIAPATGNVTFDTTNRGSSFQMVIAVYTGTSVSSLTLKTNATGAAPRVVFNASSGATYQVAVAGLNGACGDFTLELVQPTPPMFVQQPVSTNVVANFNENAVFTALAIGAPGPAYQWKVYGTNSSPATNTIPAATNGTYTITNVQGTNAGNYFCVATNSAGSTNSAVATLFVHGTSAATLNLVGYNSTSFWFQIYGLTNRAYRVESTTNLNPPISWVSVFTNYVSYFYTNFNRTNDPLRFYRAITNN